MLLSLYVQQFTIHKKRDLKRLILQLEIFPYQNKKFSAENMSVDRFFI